MVVISPYKRKAEKEGYNNQGVAVGMESEEENLTNYSKVRSRVSIKKEGKKRIRARKEGRTTRRGMDTKKVHLCKGVNVNMSPTEMSAYRDVRGKEVKKGRWKNTCKRRTTGRKKTERKNVPPGQQHLSGNRHERPGT